MIKKNITVDECLICGAPLIYSETDELMKCAVCHKKEYSKTVCKRGIMFVMNATLKNKEWCLSNQMTSDALGAIAALGGPRCCKRNSHTAIKKSCGIFEYPFWRIHGA